MNPNMNASTPSTLRTASQALAAPFAQVGITRMHARQALNAVNGDMARAGKALLMMAMRNTQQAWETKEDQPTDIDIDIEEDTDMWESIPAPPLPMDSAAVEGALLNAIHRGSTQWVGGDFQSCLDTYRATAQAYQTRYRPLQEMYHLHQMALQCFPVQPQTCLWNVRAYLLRHEFQDIVARHWDSSGRLRHVLQFPKFTWQNNPASARNAVYHYQQQAEEYRCGGGWTVGCAWVGDIVSDERNCDEPHDPLKTLVWGYRLAFDRILASVGKQSYRGEALVCHKRNDFECWLRKVRRIEPRRLESSMGRCYFMEWMKGCNPQEIGARWEHYLRPNRNHRTRNRDHQHHQQQQQQQYQPHQRQHQHHSNMQQHHNNNRPAVQNNGRRCVGCRNSKRKNAFSKNQWGKGEGKSKCKACVNNMGSHKR